MIRLNCPLCASKGVPHEDNRHDPKHMVMYRQANVCQDCAGEREKAIQHATSSEWRWRIGERHGPVTCNVQKAALVMEIPYEAVGTENSVTIHLGNGREAPKPVVVETVAVEPTVTRRRKRKEPDPDAEPAGETSGTGD